jgi:hypothetical protein
VNAGQFLWQTTDGSQQWKIDFQATLHLPACQSQNVNSDIDLPPWLFRSGIGYLISYLCSLKAQPIVHKTN